MYKESNGKDNDAWQDNIKKEQHEGYTVEYDHGVNNYNESAVQLPIA